MVKKRSCERFSIPGAVMYYRIKPRFFGRSRFTADYFPILNISKGGVSFVCNRRLRAGASLIVKMEIPDMEALPEILAEVRWIAANPEQSYRYRTGLAFKPYGDKKNQNKKSILERLESLENCFQNQAR